MLEPELKQYRQASMRAESVEEAVKLLKEAIAKSPEGKVLHIQLQPASVAEEFGNRMMLKEMDELAPKNPIVIQLRGTDRRANGLIFKMFTDYFGDLPEDIPTDKSGKPTGKIGSGAMRTLFGEVLVKKPETLAAIYKKELQSWGAQGVGGQQLSASMHHRRGPGEYQGARKV